ncbi:MAG: DEAD/DEAH box helicase [Bacillota bacterium]
MKEKSVTELSFEGLGIKDSILKAISGLGLKNPTPIQHQAIPAALKGEDIVGIARTGTGKTYAFGIPMIQRLAEVKGRGLIMLPTRELANQVEASLRTLGASLGLRTVSLIGGENIKRQLDGLRKRPHVIVATPGRLIDHLNRGSVKLTDTSVLVFDEADMMFDMGFAPQIEEVLKRVPSKRQTLLFSATMPPAVMKLAEKHLQAPVRVEVSPAGTTADLVEQEIVIVSRDSRWDQTLLLLKEYRDSVLIFVRTKHGASKLAKKLQQSGYKAAEIHSNLSFPQRQAALSGFKSGQHRILVATDVAARGLDINDIQLVLNFDLPDNSEDYVHRIGRTARAGKSGKAVSFASPDQARDVLKIEQLIQKSLPRKKVGGTNFQSFSEKDGRRKRGFSRPREDKKFVRSESRRPARPERKNFNRPEKKEMPVAVKKEEHYSSLGFKKRSDSVDITAIPDYLAPSRPSRSGSRDVRSGRNRRDAQSSPMENPTFDGGNRFAFRRKMYKLKEAARGNSRSR